MIYKRHVWNLGILDYWVDLNPGLSHIEFESPSCDSVAALIGGTPHFHG
jgi:hypothetical protein